MTGGEFDPTIAYGNKLSILTHMDAHQDKVVLNILTGRAISFPRAVVREIVGPCNSPLAPVDQPKLRFTRDLSFIPPEASSGVTQDTDGNATPVCDRGHALRDVISRIDFFRQLQGQHSSFVLCRIDVKYAYRPVLADPQSASNNLVAWVILQLSTCGFSWDKGRVRVLGNSY